MFPGAEKCWAKGRNTEAATQGRSELTRVVSGAERHLEDLRALGSVGLIGDTPLSISSWGKDCYSLFHTPSGREALLDT